MDALLATFGVERYKKKSENDENVYIDVVN